MMESGAILVYLAEKTGKFLQGCAQALRRDAMAVLPDGARRPDVRPVVALQQLAKEPGLQYARDRYNNEAARLYRVLENRLGESAWLGCDEYGIADMATYPWTKGHKARGVDDASHPNFMRWFKAVEARPAVQRNNALAAEIRERMNRAAEGKPTINIYDTRDNAARLSQATSR